MRYAITALALTLLLTASVQDSDLSQTIDEYMQRVTEERSFSGSVLVARMDEVILHSGYGTSITPDTVFDIGSVSKQFTAAAVLHAEQSGLLRIDDSIAIHLRDVPDDRADITLHQLLTHTAGFREDHFEGDLTPMSTGEALNAIYALPMHETTYHYSNTGYTLLALIVQEVSGQPFTDYLHEHLFDPAGMVHTGFYSEPRWESLPVATTYFNGTAQGSPAAWPGPYWGVLGNGGVMSTTGDLYRWVQALRTTDVLSAEQVEKFFTPYTSEQPGGSIYYAYGWTVEETDRGTLIQHNGGGIGGNSHLAMYPDEGLTVIVTSNRIVYRPPLEIRLPATDTVEQLTDNIFTGDFSTLPRPTWNAYPWVGTLAVVLASLVGWLWYRRARGS